jgi:hypothetical protein
VAAVLSSTGMAIGCRREELEGGSIAVEDGAAGGAYYRLGGWEVAVHREGMVDGGGCH